ncbi:hypothetical protein KC341_g58 [Hortaea werneckii]|nr:hypothetical protein KC341_g58 [Hortaea werneckii]
MSWRTVPRRSIVASSFLTCLALIQPQSPPSSPPHHHHHHTNTPPPPPPSPPTPPPQPPPGTSLSSPSPLPPTRRLLRLSSGRETLGRSSGLRGPMTSSRTTDPSGREDSRIVSVRRKTPSCHRLHHWNQESTAQPGLFDDRAGSQVSLARDSSSRRNPTITTCQKSFMAGSGILKRRSSQPAVLLRPVGCTEMVSNSVSYLLLAPACTYTFPSRPFISFWR